MLRKKETKIMNQKKGVDVVFRRFYSRYPNRIITRIGCYREFYVIEAPLRSDYNGSNMIIQRIGSSIYFYNRITGRVREFSHVEKLKQISSSNRRLVYERK